MNDTVTLGTRRSRLARVQSELIATRLREVAADLEVKIVPIGTTGDRDRRTPLAEFGGMGVFTAELERALEDGRIGIAVHSLKDLPVDDGGTCVLGALVGPRDAADVLVSRDAARLDELPPGARIGTGSVRRAAQLLALRPDLRIAPIRGNVETRIRKVMEGEFDATVLAAAGLQRLGLEHVVAQRFSLETVLPAPGQGVLAVQCRTADTRTRHLLALIDDPLCRAAVTAERSFLRALGGGCSSPVAACATVAPGGSRTLVTLRGTVLAPDGSTRIQVETAGFDPDSLGRDAARQALSRGAGALLRRTPPLQPESMSLRGLRILVTRPKDQAATLIRLLRRRGAQVVPVPLIRIVPEANAAHFQRLRELSSRWSHYSTILFTSGNSVRVLLNQLENQGLVAPEGDTLRIAAVGPATAAALREHGLEPSVMPGTYTAEDLVKTLGPLQNQSILLPQGHAAGTTLVDQLQDGGATVDHLQLYRTEELKDVPALAAALQEPLDAVTLTSGSAARAFAAGLRTLGLAAEVGPLTATRIACIGPSTAAEARRLGLPVHEVAREHTMEGLVAALERLYQKTPEEGELHA